MYIDVKKEGSLESIRLPLLDRMDVDGSEHLIFQSEEQEVVVIEISNVFKVVDSDHVVFDHWAILDHLASQMSNFTTYRAICYFGFIDDVHDMWFTAEINKHFTQSSAFSFDRTTQQEMESKLESLRTKLIEASKHREKPLKGFVNVKVFENGRESSVISVLDTFMIKKTKQRRVHSMFTVQ